MPLFHRIVSIVFSLSLLTSTGIDAQEIRSRLVSFQIPLSDDLVSPTKEIDINHYLKLGYAFWHAHAKVEVHLAHFQDSIYSQTTTDSLGYFNATLPPNEKCYIKIEGAKWQDEEDHLPLYIKNIKQNYILTAPFIPYLRSSYVLGEYLYVKQERKFPFQKEKWVHVYQPSKNYDPYALGSYTFRYNDHQCHLLKEDEHCEIQFPRYAHPIVDLNVKKIKSRLDSMVHLEDSLYQISLLNPDEEFVKSVYPMPKEASFFERVKEGKAGFQRFIDKRRKSPDRAPLGTLCFSVQVSCVLNRDGRLSYPLVVKSHDAWHDQEALRLIGILPPVRPTRSRHPIPRRLVTINIDFRYPFQGNGQR